MLKYEDRPLGPLADNSIDSCDLSNSISTHLSLAGFLSDFLVSVDQFDIVFGGMFIDRLI